MYTHPATGVIPPPHEQGVVRKDGNGDVDVTRNQAVWGNIVVPKGRGRGAARPLEGEMVGVPERAVLRGLAM